MSAQSRPGILRGLLAGGILLLLVSALAVCPSAARTDIRHIGVGDMIFIYEQNIDITGLRTGANPVTALRKYVDDNPARALLREVAVQNDTSFSPIPESFGGQYGVYYAFNPASGAMNSVLVGIPQVSIDAVLASPNHADSIQGLTVSEDTRIAFKVASVDVGTYYHAGALYPATVDLVLTVPGGAERSSVQGRDFSAMNVNGPVFYTDDPGRPGAITFEGLGAGTYSIQARWRDPASFNSQAPDSNSLSFTIGGTTVPRTTTAPVTTPMTTRTTIPTPIPSTTPPAAPTTPVATTTTPTPQPATTTTTGTPVPSPTATPTGAGLAFLAPAMAILARIMGKRGR
jgi:hypothetical protein